MIDYGFGAKLGPMSACDTKKIYEWRNDPRVYKWCRQFEPLEYSNHLKWLESLGGRKDVSMYSILRECEAGVSLIDEVIGVCGLTSLDMINRHAEFSIYVAPTFWGSGYGKKALQTLVQHGFHALGLKHIYGETFDGNPAAKDFEKVGFRREGTRRKFYFRDGKFIDAHLYSLLDEEFEAKCSA